MIKKFTIKEALKAGFEKMKQYWTIVLGAGLLTLVISMAFELVNELLSDGRHSEPSLIAVLLSLIVSLASVAFSILTSYNMMKMVFKMHDGVTPKITDIFHYDKKNLSKMGYFFLASIIYAVLVFVGLILLIIPGIYFAVKYGFSLYLMIDKNMGIKESFEESAKMTKGHMCDLVLFGLACMLLVIGGLLLLVVGFIPAYIIVIFANVYVYRKLTSVHNHAAHDHTEKTLSV